jgi:predicted nucleotidyltransferase
LISLRSKITQRVLGYFMLHETAQIYVNEMARRLDLDPGNLTRKLKELEEEGILKSDLRGKQRYYALNTTHPLFKEYKRIILKTVGLEHLLKEALLKVPGIQTACLFGSYARNRMDSASDIDLLIVGTHDTVEVQRKIASIQKSVDREINVVSMSPREYRNPKKKHPLLQAIQRAAHIDLL